MVDIDVWLKRKNLRKKDLAGFLDILPQNVNRVIHNPNLSLATLEEICGFLGIGMVEAMRTSEKKMQSVFPKNFMEVPLVQQYAYGEYLNSSRDEEYISELPKIPFIVDKEFKGNYLCFEIKGESMDDGSSESYIEGDILLAREVSSEYWKTPLHLKRWKDFVIVHRTEGILTKRVISHDPKLGTIRIHSLNTLYTDRTLFLNDVYKLFNIVKTIRSK